MDLPDYRSTFDSMESVARKVATSLGWEREARLIALNREWGKIFGDPIARVSYPSALLDKELVVAFSSPLWKRELTFLLPEIRTKLQNACPDLAGISLVFRTVRPFSPPLSDRRKVPLSSVPIESLWIRAEEIASRLPPPLRERGRAFVLQQLLQGQFLADSSSAPSPSAS